MWKKHVIGTTNKVPFYTKAEFIKITPKGNASFKIGKNYYYLNTSLLNKDSGENKPEEDLQGGVLYEIQMLVNTSLKIHKITRIYLTGYRPIEQNFDKNQGILYAKNEEYFKFSVLSVSKTSKPNVSILVLKNKLGDMHSVRVIGDATNLNGTTISATLKLKSTQDHICWNEQHGSWECYFLTRDVEYTDKEGKLVKKKDERRYVPVLELGDRWIDVKPADADEEDNEETEE